MSTYTNLPVTVSTAQQLPPLTGPTAQGYLNRLFFGLAENGTTYAPFSISANTVPNDRVVDCNLQGDKIILAGTTITVPNTTLNHFAIARYLPGGLIDPTFGQVNTPRAGTAYIPFYIAANAPGALEDLCSCSALQSTGKIVLGGIIKVTGTTLPDLKGCFGVARFTADGQLDTTFGGGGAAQPGTQFINFNIAGIDSLAEVPFSIAVDNANNIVLAGVATGAAGPRTYFTLARFLPNGQLDPSFDQAGAKAGTLFINFNIATGTTLDSAGDIILQNVKILLCGISATANTSCLSLARSFSCPIFTKWTA